MSHYQSWAKWFYNSAAWRKLRDAYFIARHGICERCGEAGRIVHHKEHLTPENIHDPAVSLNWDELELLCQTCHNQEHHGNGGVVADGMAFDADGNLVARS